MSDQETNRDIALRGGVVLVTDGRLKEMQEHAVRFEGLTTHPVSHWHWAAALNELIAARAENARLKGVNTMQTEGLAKLDADNAALRAEVEKWKAYRVHDVEEKEWLRDQVIALRAALREYVNEFPAPRNDMRPIVWDDMEDRACALLAEGK
jgi:hypothetical protein